MKTKKRIGFACKLSTLDTKKGVVAIPEYNTQTTTLTWLNRQTKLTAYKKLESLMQHNVNSIYRLVEKVGSWDPELRMVRLSSEILPAYTAPGWSDFYQSADIQNYLHKKFMSVGDLARNLDVRLSFHPGQFTVLASDRPEVVENSIREFEYHCDMAGWMGYGKSFQDFKINIHISGKRGALGIISVLPRLSAIARNCITIENEEYSYGLDSVLELADHVAIVLDLHHHWVKTGEYISADDSRIQKICQSWRDVRPVIHYSISPESLLAEHCENTMPDHVLLLESGYKKAGLRAHSDFMWNKAVNQWALSHWQWADIMVESKAKNLASRLLYEQFNR